MANALASESSPYLRQHAHNPVQWLPWGPDAFARARARNVPVLVSIGYSSCHWCHVMERESFEDKRTASVMNDSFVCVKVDREERPDVDALYMEAVQGMTGHGGWPLNVFLTPSGLPFYGGTYFPPDERPGMPAFTQVLQAVAEAWEQRGEEIAAAGEQLREQLTGAARLQPSEQPLDPQSLDRAVEQAARSFDPLHGGFSSAPKFPQAPAIEFLLLRGERAQQMALYTLRSMASGGIHDQIGGGFHRYSVDANWTVPHFEKMLYDNALLARAYLHAFQLSGEERLCEVCRDTLNWILREMRGPEGGFYSALDADSDGVEGRYYVWTVAQLHEALGGSAQAGKQPPAHVATAGSDASSGAADGDASSGEQAVAHIAADDSDAAIRWLGATQQGNFQDPHHPAPGLNVLEDRGPRPEEAVRRRIVQRLLAARDRRTRPGLDDKRLASWNALTICALADAGAALGEPRYLDAAIRCADFILTHMRRPDGGLLRTYSGRRANGNGRADGHSPLNSEGHAKIDAFLEDHAFLLEALIALFEATCEERWLGEAHALAERTIERFADPQRGGFYSTASHAEPLIARRKDLEDSPIPSGNSSAALGLARLAQLTGEQRFQHEAMRTLALLHEIAPRHPLAFGHLLQAIHWQLAPMRPIACELPAR